MAARGPPGSHAVAADLHLRDRCACQFSLNNMPNGKAISLKVPIFQISKVPHWISGPVDYASIFLMVLNELSNWNIVPIRKGIHANRPKS